jgi:hypothetical protein
MRDWFQRRRRQNEQWRREVAAQHLDSVNQLANLSDAELIATSPTIQNLTHQMEMDRRLKVAIVELTSETIAARKSSDRPPRDSCGSRSSSYSSRPRWWP